MKLFDYTHADPAGNLACDEALLDWCEDNNGEDTLRFWEPRNYFVVLGYAGKAREEVHAEYCAQAAIPVLRRTSGGGTVLQGAGCLNYSLILNIASAKELSTLSGSNEFIMRRHAAALSSLLGKPAEVRGHTDLAFENRKFSGNAQRRKSRYLLFHGSFLLHMDIALISKALTFPATKPAYREERSHQDFLLNLPLAADSIKRALAKTWSAKASWPGGFLDAEITKLAAEKYSSAAWNDKF